MKLIELNGDNSEYYFKFWYNLYIHPEVNPYFFKPSNYGEDLLKNIYLAYIADKKIRFFIYADKADRPIGTFRFTFFEGKHKHAAVINAVAIDPSQHRGGHGTTLLNLAKNFIKDKYPAITQLELSYEGDNLVARRFYQVKNQFEMKYQFEDWFIRPEPAFVETHPWYTDERSMVHYFKDKPKPVVIESTVAMDDLPSLSDTYSLKKVKELEIYNIKKSYTAQEAQLLQKMLEKPGIETYALYQNTEVVAVLGIQPYSEEPRLKHAALIPFIAYINELQPETIAGFINQTVNVYRQEQSHICYFANIEEGIEEDWYTDKHSKFESLNKALQLAGFKYKGACENYFNSEEGEEALLAYERVHLNLQDAMRCIDVSNKLTPIQKEQLKELIGMIQMASSREKYELYRMCRSVAYPQDYTNDEKIKHIAESIALLKQGKNYKENSDIIEQLHAALLAILQPTQSLSSNQNSTYFPPRTTVENPNSATLNDQGQYTI